MTREQIIVIYVALFLICLLFDNEGLGEWLKSFSFLFTRPKMLLCFGIAWFITNGWSYLFVALGGFLHIKWMIAIGTAYLGFLWLPFTPEKIITVAISIWLAKAFFPKDNKLQAQLQKLSPKKILSNK